MEQLFFYKNFGKDIFRCEDCGSFSVFDRIDDRITVYRASESRENPADVLGQMPVTPELSTRIRGGECPVCSAWTDEDGKTISLEHKA